MGASGCLREEFCRFLDVDSISGSDRSNRSAVIAGPDGLAGTAAIRGSMAARCWSDGGFMFLLILDQNLFNDIGNLLPHAFHRVGIDVDTLDRFGRLAADRLPPPASWKNHSTCGAGAAAPQ